MVRIVFSDFVFKVFKVYITHCNQEDDTRLYSMRTTQYNGKFVQSHIICILIFWTFPYFRFRNPGISGFRKTSDFRNP